MKGDRPASILILEDNRDVADTLRDLFEGEGYAVRTAETCAECASALAAEEPDLLVLDVNLPDGNGLDLLRAIRGDGTHARLPVVVFTADAREERLFDGFERGANAFLEKPIRTGRLFEAVRRLLAERREE